MPCVQLTKDNFDSTVDDNNMVIVDFWAPWCGPCRAFAPVFEASSDKYPDVVFGKVNTEEERDLAASFGIRSIPTLMVLREKVILFAEAGALRAPQLEALIEQAQALDMEVVHREIAEQAGQQSAATETADKPAQ